MEETGLQLSNSSSLGDRPNTTALKSFAIDGLFGYLDVKIPLEKEATILIAENGAGKTTIIRMLAHTLQGKFGDLLSFEFDLIKIASFAMSSSEIALTKEEIERTSKGVQPQTSKIKLSGIVGAGGISFGRTTTNIVQHEGGPIVVQNYYNEPDDLPLSTSQQNVISNNSNKNSHPLLPKDLKFSVLYLPTYRRIEENLEQIDSQTIYYGLNSASQQGGEIINFGMNDIAENFDRLTREIQNLAFDSFARVNGEMLGQLVKGIEVTDEMRQSIAPATLNRILRRVGEKNISQGDRETIERLVASGDINSPQYNQLVYFLYKLLKQYEQQQEKEAAIQQFAEVCNRYLQRKQIVYDETTADISLQQTRDGQPVDLKNLSSGEKQIVSLFSKVYLEANDDFILIIDEPELSLSIEWQRSLLPDILRSGKCKLLIAATHSPFIFDNELDGNAYDLSEFITER